LIYDDDIQDKLKEIERHIKKEYIDTHPKEEMDWRTYEQRFSKRIKEAIASLDPLIHEAVSTIKIEPRTGRPDALNLEQKVKLLLVKQLVGESNRMFANMLDIFSFHGIPKPTPYFVRGMGNEFWRLTSLKSSSAPKQALFPFA
jgi:hypothetical protein